MIKEIKIKHYIYPDGSMLYSGSIIYSDGDISGTSVYTNGALTEWFIENLVPEEIWRKCIPEIILT